ncbi:MAG: PIN domain-containing protein [Candidatus Rokubacteria bacterium]|nr:PIN domain-containing protein [Candidatus Rokubacteria bacterium]
MAGQAGVNVLVDSSVLIDVLRDRLGRPALLQRLVTQGSLLCSCDVTLAEVYAGMMERERPVTDALLESLYYVPSDPHVARAAGLLRGEWRRKGVTLTLMDACLAALAMRRGLVLLSDNARHFPMKGLVVWTPHDAASKLP